MNWGSKDLAMNPNCQAFASHFRELAFREQMPTMTHTLHPKHLLCTDSLNIYCVFIHAQQECAHVKLRVKGISVFTGASPVLT